MSYTIEVRGLEQVQAKFSIPLAVALQPAFLAIGNEVKAAIAVYPGPVRYPIQWASEKQRRYFFAHRQGALPYVRSSDAESQRLGPSWAVELQPFGVIVGTRVTYAPFVQDAERQQPFHRNTGWKTDQKAAQEVAEGGMIERACWLAIEHVYG